MRNNHTPGPWKVGVSAENGIHCVDAIDPNDSGIIEICEVWGTVDDMCENAESTANLRLIVSSPDLYDVLKDIVENGYGMYAESQARRLLQKIEEGAA